ALLVVSERIWPTAGRGKARGAARFDAPFVFLVQHAPRVLAISGLVCAALGTAAIAHYVRSDPLEYDLKKIGTDVPESKEQYRLSSLAADIVGIKTESSMAVLCDRIDQVIPLEKALEARRDSVPHDERPFESVYALQDFVPEEQAAKIPVALAVKKRIMRAHARGGISDADYAEALPFMPPDDISSFALADLPESL